MGSSLKKVVFVVLFNLFAILFLLVSIEIGVRIFIPEIGPLGTDAELFIPNRFENSRGLNPNAEGISYGKIKTVDTKGFWKYERTNGSTSPQTILLLGDSVTMGIGVEQNLTFGALLQDYFDDSITILNPSVIGYSVADYRNVIKTLLDENKPLDEIHIVWCLNDIYADLSVETAPDGQIQLGRELIRFLHRNVYMYQWLKNIFANRPAVYYNHDIQMYDQNSPWFARSTYILLDLNKYLTELEIPFKVWISPYLEQLLLEDEEGLADFIWALDTIGIHHLNMYNYFIEAEDHRQLYLFGDGIHLSKNGHAKVYEIMKKHLQN